MIRIVNHTNRPVRLHLADRFADYTESLIEIAPYTYYEPDGCPTLPPLTLTLQSIGECLDKPRKHKKKKHKKHHLD